MSIFFVYLNHYRDGVIGDPGYNRAILTCESRYVADEFFRELEKFEYGGAKAFMILKRHGPQLWQYGNAGGWLAIHNTLRTAAFADFATKIMLSQAPNADVQVSPWPVAKIDDGPDWLNNGTYFIRNRRQPQLYWFSAGGYIQISEKRKTRFRIHALDMADNENKVLIRSDRIEILLAEENLPAYIGRERPTNLLSMCGDSVEWRFRDFVNGFGTVSGTEVKDVEHVRSVRRGEGDEWELC